MTRRIYAVFREQQGAEAALATLNRAVRHGRCLKLLVVHRELTVQTAQTPPRGRLERVPTKMIEPALTREGLPFGQNRLLSGLMRQGGALLVWQQPPGGDCPVALLREAGALHVAAVPEGDVAQPAEALPVPSVATAGAAAAGGQ